MKNPMLNSAVGAARQASAIILRSLDRLDKLTITEKNRNDFVTNIDHKSEKIIIETLKKSYPDHGFLAEESGAIEPQCEAQYRWVIDPLDGTKNFMRGFPHFSISMALMAGNSIQLGLIYDPVRNECFTAVSGKGAHLNDQRIRVSKTLHLEHALLGTGFPHWNRERMDLYTKGLLNIMPRVSGIRRAGSAALDLAYVACGRLDGFWEYDLKPWDIAAGILIVREAGGFIANLISNQDDPIDGHILASNTKIFRPLLQQLRKP